MDGIVALVIGLNFFIFSSSITGSYMLLVSIHAVIPSRKARRPGWNIPLIEGNQP